MISSNAAFLNTFDRASRVGLCKVWKITRNWENQLIVTPLYIQGKRRCERDQWCGNDQKFSHRFFSWKIPGKSTNGNSRAKQACDSPWSCLSLIYMQVSHETLNVLSHDPKDLFLSRVHHRAPCRWLSAKKQVFRHDFISICCLVASVIRFWLDFHWMFQNRLLEISSRWTSSVAIALCAWWCVLAHDSTLYFPSENDEFFDHCFSNSWFRCQSRDTRAHCEWC